MKLHRYLLFFLLIALTAPAFASRHFNFQGRLTDAAGTPITAATTVAFSLWQTTGTAVDGFTPIYVETHTVNPDVNGVYTVLIGTINTSLPSIYFGSDVWLDVNVNGESISPRFPLTSSPNAISAKWAGVRDVPPQYLYGSGLQKNLRIDALGSTVLNHAFFINFSTSFSASYSILKSSGVDVDFNTGSTTSFTTQGNTFNQATKLLQLNGSGALPSINANQMTLVDPSTLTVQGSGMKVGGTGFVVRNGNVGIGTAAPSVKLYVTTGDFILDGTDPFVNIDGSTFWISNRRVGMGTSSPDLALSVNDDASKVGGGTWQTFSDIRLKDVSGPFVDGLSEVLRLSPVRYHYKADNPLNLPSNTEYIGFIAQDVQKVIPDAVRTTSNGYLTLGSDPILWSMLNAIKEMSAKNDALKARIAQLENSRSR